MSVLFLTQNARFLHFFKVRPGNGVVRIDLQRRAEVSRGLLGIVELEKNQAQSVVRFEIIRLQTQRRFKLRLRFVPPAKVEKCQPEIIMRLSEVGLELHRGLKM